MLKRSVIFASRLTCLVIFKSHCSADVSPSKMNQGFPSFLYDIPSVFDKLPAVPAAVGNLNLDHGIAAGDLLDYQHVTHARAVATALKGLQGELNSDWRLSPWCIFSHLCVESGDEPLVTQQMVATAVSRAAAVETACTFHVFTRIKH